MVKICSIDQHGAGVASVIPLMDDIASPFKQDTKLEGDYEYHCSTKWNASLLLLRILLGRTKFNLAGTTW